MPLSHVCVWDADIGYKRISLESACKMYPNGASAKSGYFVCELCAQNVLLTAPGVNVRHFRHDPSSPNKECDERQAHFDPLYGRRLRNLNSHLMPLRITVAKESFAYKGAHKTVILKITIMASVRQGWERNNGYLVKAGYPLFFCRHEKQQIYSQLSGIIALNQSYPIHSEIFSKNLKKVQKHWNNSAVLMPYIVEG